MIQDEEIIQLLREITSSITCRLNKCYERYGLTAVQFFVLMEVSQHDGCKLSDLASHLHMSPSNISAIIKRMEQHGLLKRCRSTIDERIVTIHLQTKANDILTRMKDDMLDHHSLGTSLNNTQKEQIIQSLQLLNNVIKKECMTHE